MPDIHSPALTAPAFPVPARRRPLLHHALASAAALALAACTTVGPDYHGAPALDTATTGPLVRAGSGTAPAAPDAPATGTAANTADAPSGWWHSLDDPTLDALVAQALTASPDLHVAEARLRQARAALQDQQAANAPKVSASALALGLSSGPGTAAEQNLHFYNAGFDATWEIDLFGGTRRAVEAAQAQAGQSQAQLADAQVSLAAEVVQAYAELRAAQQRMQLLRELAALGDDTLALARQRRERGVDSELDLQSQLARTQAAWRSAHEAEAAIPQALDRLALLCGQPSGSLDARLGTPTATLPTVPRDVAVGDVTTLLQHRPDIRSAERLLAARTAQIGQQQAGYFPKLTLLGDIGLGATNPGDLLQRSSLTLLGAPYLSWNVLDFGRTAANVRKAEAGRDEALAQYQAAVLQALNDANTALSRYGQQRTSLQDLQQQQATAERSLALTRQRRAAGAASQFDVQDAQRTVYQARRDTLDAQATLVKDFAALSKSLGLGWSQAS